MTINLKDKVVLITGSTGGLGKATAKALLEKGAKLALLDLDQAAIQAQVEELGGETNAFGCAANVCSLQDLEQCYAAVHRHFGRIDVVIANAGVGYTEPLETMTEQSFEKMIDV
ncbi:MAG: SDR family NAD(P)-dependent oxidoreductase, partial [Polynucleobacter sp.]|nr:SDR family NAD(P)-dependent oxidoreductase [Polynucleobacter sp.]